MNDNDYLTIKDCTFIWKISNFNNRCSRGVKEKILSPIFTLGDLVSDKIQWCLHLYPYGDKNENKNYLSVFLNCILNDNDIEECTVLFEFELWNNNKINNKRKRIQNTNTFSRTSSSWGYSRFIFRQEEELKDHLASSENNTLSIACFIRNITPRYTSGLNHYVELIRGFDSIFLSENFSDVTIQVDNKTLKAHKVILSARSDVFSAMFKHGTVETKEGVIKIEDISYDVMKEVLRFIYCGKVENLNLHKTDLLAAATKYNLVALKDCCEEAFWKHFSIDNVCEILNIADLYQCNKLKAGAIQFMIDNIETAFKTSEFFELIESNPNLLIDFFHNAVLKKKK